MSRLISGKLLAGVIFGDKENNEYIYLPGGEVGAENPLCVMERNGVTTDLGVEEASEMVLHLALKPCSHPVYGKKAF